MILKCGLWDLSSLTKDRTWAMAMKAPSPNHGTAREFPKLWYFSGPLRLCCDLQKYLTLPSHTLGGTESLEGVGLGKFSFTDSDEALEKYFFLTE